MILRELSGTASEYLPQSHEDTKNCFVKNLCDSSWLCEFVVKKNSTMTRVTVNGHALRRKLTEASFGLLKMDHVRDNDYS